MRLLPYGDRAVLAELDGLDEALALYRALDTDRAVGVEDLIPAARTVLVLVDPRILPLEAARRWVLDSANGAVEASDARPSEVHTISVVYDGADLEAVAAEFGCSVPDLVARHTALDWTVAFGGFAPGFAYLAPSGDWPEVPRLDSPRTAVPAGSVAVAGRFSGIYPRSSPGGWRLLGRTDVVLWDLQRQPPALLQPGSVVRFEAAP